MKEIFEHFTEDMIVSVKVRYIYIFGILTKE